MGMASHSRQHILLASLLHRRRVTTIVYKLQTRLTQSFPVSRHRLQAEDNKPRRDTDQAANLGHSWSGALQDLDHGILPWRYGHHSHVRHHQP